MKKKSVTSKKVIAKPDNEPVVSKTSINLPELNQEQLKHIGGGKTDQIDDESQNF